MIVSVHNEQCDMYGTVQYSTGDLTSWHSTMYNGKGRMGWRKESRHYDPGAGMVNGQRSMLY